MRPATPNLDALDLEIFRRHPMLKAILRRPYDSEARYWRTPGTRVVSIEVTLDKDFNPCRVPFVVDLDA